MEIVNLNPTALNAELDDPWVRAYVVWLSELRSSYTRQSYNAAWRAFQKSNKLHPGAIETDDVRIWKIKLQKDYAPTSVNLKLSAISSFYKHICENHAHLRDDNPCDNVTHLAIKPYGKATRLVKEQDRELLASIDRSTLIGKRDYAILILFLTTGVRLAAVTSATPENFRRQGAVTFFHYIGKSAKAQKKVLPTNTSHALYQYTMATVLEEDQPIFALSRHQIQDMVVKRCNAVFGPGHGITVHSLRHTAANNASKHGSIQDVRALLDHESTRVTSVYLDYIDDEQAERMSNVLDNRY